MTIKQRVKSRDLCNPRRSTSRYLGADALAVVMLGVEDDGVVLVHEEPQQREEHRDHAVALPHVQHCQHQLHRPVGNHPGGSAKTIDKIAAKLLDSSDTGFVCDALGKIALLCLD